MQPALPTFATTARSWARRIYTMRDLAVIRFSHLADTAFVCFCSTTVGDFQQTSPERSFKIGFGKQIQSVLSLTGWATIETRTKRNIAR